MSHRTILDFMRLVLLLLLGIQEKMSYVTLSDIDKFYEYELHG